MKSIVTILLILGMPFTIFAQENLKDALSRLNSGEVPYISVEELKMAQSNGQSILLLDAREKEEYEVSHLQQARYVGYSDFSIEDFKRKNVDKDQQIIVYCSIGVRSENIAAQLQQAGYTRVLNLYGGIFEWKNKHYEVVDEAGNTTEKVHAYSKRWGKLLHAGQRVYKP